MFFFVQKFACEFPNTALRPAHCGSGLQEAPLTCTLARGAAHSFSPWGTAPSTSSLRLGPLSTANHQEKMGKTRYLPMKRTLVCSVRADTGAQNALLHHSWEAVGRLTFFAALHGGLPNRAAGDSALPGLPKQDTGLGCAV